MKAKIKDNLVKTAFQKFAASFVILIGLFVFLSTANTITGNAIGGTGNIKFLDIFIAIWGVLILGVGLWMWHYKNFHESVFERYSEKHK